MKILLNNCTLLSKEKVNIYIENGIIKKISPENINVRTDITYNLDKKLVVPGLCDINFSALSSTNKEIIQSETNTALKSGFTSMLELSENCVEKISNYNDILREQINIFNRFSNINFGFGYETDLSFPLGEFKWYFVCPTIKVSLNSFKITNNKSIVEFIKKIEEVSSYCESIIISIKDKNIETFFKYFKNKNIKVGFIDINSIDEIKRINNFKENGFKYYSIVYIDSLFFSDEMMGNHIKRTKFSIRCNYPSNDDLKEMNVALKENLIDIVIPNHSLATIIDKFEFAKVGNPGFETFIPLLIDLALYLGIDLEVLDSVLFKKLRDFLGLKRQLIIKEGAIASIVAIDIDKFWFVTENDVKSLPGWTPYEGRRIWGIPILTICNGLIGYDSSSNKIHPIHNITCRLLSENEEIN